MNVCVHVCDWLSRSRLLQEVDGLTADEIAKVGNWFISEGLKVEGKSCFSFSVSDVTRLLNASLKRYITHFCL